MDQTLDSESRAKVTKNVFKEVDRLNRIISEMMEYAKPEKMPIDQVQVDEIFKDVLESRIEKWKPIYEQVLAGNKLYFEDERIIRNKVDYVEINLNPVYDQNGKIVGCMGITRDINAAKKKEIERKNYIQKLEEFAFKTSHELRRPLANILGIVPLLMEEKNEEQFTFLLEALKISVQDLDLEVKAMNDTINKK
jgi:signal transduction histidine kinase